MAPTQKYRTFSPADGRPKYATIQPTYGKHVDLRAGSTHHRPDRQHHERAHGHGADAAGPRDTAARAGPAHLGGGRLAGVRRLAAARPARLDLAPGDGDAGQRRLRAGLHRLAGWYAPAFRRTP